MVTRHILIAWLVMFVLVAGCEQTPPTVPGTENAASAPVPNPALVPMSAFQQGIAYASWWHGEFSSPASDAVLAHSILPTGANWVSIVVTCYQQRVNSTVIECHPKGSTPSDDDLTHVIAHAHRLGLRVMLKPHLDLPGTAQRWRGEIGLGFNEAAWQAWFESYTGFITHYAELARNLGVDYFVVGTELSGTVRREEQWRALISKVRGIYPGPLTYASHHDTAQCSINWWDALDAIGIDAYYPLAQDGQHTVEQLKAAWAPIVMKLGQISRTWQRPIILTEIGYESIEGSSRTPWKAHGHQIDHEEQSDSYHAVFEAFKGQEWWHGVFWWVWTVDSSRISSLNNDFSACGKPAENILREHFGGQPHPRTKAAAQLGGTPPLDIFVDALSADWQNWSWDADLKPVTRRWHGEENTSLMVTFQSWGALSLRHPGIDTAPYARLEFFIYVGDDDKRHLTVSLNDRDDRALSHNIELPSSRYLEGGKFLPNRWQRVSIPLSDMDASNKTITRLNIKDNSGQDAMELFIDNLRFGGEIALQNQVTR